MTKRIRMKYLDYVLFLAILLAPVMAADAAPVLIHQYGFNGSGVTDSVGSANGTLYGGATVSGGVLTLDGVNDFVQFATLIIPSSGSYSVALRAQELTHFNRYVEFISQGVVSGSSFYIGYDPTGQMRLGDYYMYTGASFPNDGKYHMYAAVVDAVSNTTSLYIDGTLLATKNSAITSNSNPFGYTKLGQQFSPYYYYEFFAGNIDDVRVYSGALSASDVGILNSTSVPEPGAMLLLGSGLLGLVAMGRKKFRK